MAEILSLAACNLRRLVRIPVAAALLVILTSSTTVLEIVKKLETRPSIPVIILSSLLAFAVQAVVDRRQGFTAGLKAAGITRATLFAGRLLSMSGLLLILYLLRSTLLHIL